MNQDLTVGKPETVLWKFCMPLFGSIILQQWVTAMELQWYLLHLHLAVILAVP